MYLSLTVLKMPAGVVSLLGTGSGCPRGPALPRGGDGTSLSLLRPSPGTSGRCDPETGLSVELCAVGVAGDFGARRLEKLTASLPWGLPWHRQCRGCSCCSLPLVGAASEVPAEEQGVGAACRGLQCDPALPCPAQSRERALISTGEVSA